MKIFEKYEATIGLEIHAQLTTRTKAYSSDENIYGAIPNTKTSPVTLGHPVTLPVSNSEVIKHAVKLGIALDSKIRRFNEYARKNYFYADLPKGYQITQDSTPICNGGVVEINDQNKEKRIININRIHMEEDAGKSIHDLDPFNTLIDLNRAGVPLLEIVSEPEIKNSQEAYEYIQEIRKILRYLEICDGNMEEGSLRCDANISVKLVDAKKLGTKVEVKNMNSTNNVKKAIDFEIERQIHLLEKGKEIIHETRSFNASDGSTIYISHKEDANDYRYFPEPDLQPGIIEQEFIEKIKNELPLLPKELFEKFTKDFQLSDYDANILIEDKEIALYFIETIKHTKDYKAAANFINGTLRSYLNEYAKKIDEINILPKNIAMIVNLVNDQKISHSIAKNNVFPLMIKNNDEDPYNIAKKNNWIQDSNQDHLAEIIETVLQKYPQKVKEYHSGKKGLIGMFMGEIMKISKGTADPKLANQILNKKLSNKD